MANVACLKVGGVTIGVMFEFEYRATVHDLLTGRHSKAGHKFVDPHTLKRVKFIM